MLASLATIMKQKLDVVTPLVYFAFTSFLTEACTCVLLQVKIRRLLQRILFIGL